MSRIRILDKSLASKIAAGEVVERPESVLKELLENSIDAGATVISVTVAEGGKRLLRVADNGSGMAREDAPLAFFRHATSKISTEEDLERIMTMGFRGEALASISAVSRVMVRTRRPGDIAGTRVSVEGGSEPEVSGDGCPEGTSVEVKDLFYNTPARLKFLRGAEAEYGRMLDTFRKIALANPDRRFRIVHGSGRPLDAPPGSLKERISDLFGADTVKTLFTVDTPDLRGLIGNHEPGYPTARYLHTYVNGRWVRDRAVNRAIIEGYGQLLENNRYPFAVLDLIVPPEDVDVNIHPAKAEVRFRNQNYIFDLVKYGVRGALSRPAQPQAAYGEAHAIKTPAGTGRSLGEATAPYGPAERTTQLDLREDTDGVINPGFLGLEVIGQLWGEFMVAQTPDREGEVFLVDQHGAAERCAFEKLKKRHASGKVVRQALLIPERFETTPEEKEEVLKALDYLSGMGFEIAPFGPSIDAGGETFLIKSVPELLSSMGSAALIKGLAQELSSYGGSSRVEEGMDRALMRIACHSVVRGPRALAREEAQALLGDLARTDFSGHCPHGRPIVKKVSRREIEKMFGR